MEDSNSVSMSNVLVSAQRDFCKVHMRLYLNTSNAIKGFGIGPGPIQLSIPCLDLAFDHLRTCSYEATDNPVKRYTENKVSNFVIEFLGFALPPLTDLVSNLNG